MKICLSIMAVLVVATVFGQNIPVKNNRIHFEGSIPLKDQSAAYLRIHQWVLSNKDHNILLADKDQQVIMCTLERDFRKTVGMQRHFGQIQFLVSASVKDGALYYQVYNFKYQGTQQSVIESMVKKPEELDLDEALEEYNKGKSRKFNNAFLSEIPDIHESVLNELKASL